MVAPPPSPVVDQPGLSPWTAGGAACWGVTVADTQSLHCKPSASVCVTIGLLVDASCPDCVSEVVLVTR